MTRVVTNLQQNQNSHDSWANKMVCNISGNLSALIFQLLASGRKIIENVNNLCGDKKVL